MRTLRELREAKGLSVVALAAAAGVAQRTAYAAEQGRHVPRVGNMWRIAAALDTVPLEIAEFHRAMTEQPTSTPDSDRTGEKGGG